jgi:hypothetical protein
MWARAYEYVDSQRQPREYQEVDAAVANEDAELEAELRRVEGLLDRADDEGIPLYSREAFNRARSFLKAQSAKAKKMYSRFSPIPDIGPGPNGSIDLHWKLTNRELLVNVPADKPAVYYGDDYGVGKHKGNLDPTTSDFGIILWLMHK